MDRGRGMNFLARLKLKELSPSYSGQNVLITHNTKARGNGNREKKWGAECERACSGGKVKSDKGGPGSPALPRSRVKN